MVSISFGRFFRGDCSYQTLIKYLVRFIMFLNVKRFRVWSKLSFSSLRSLHLLSDKRLLLYLHYTYNHELSDDITNISSFIRLSLLWLSWRAYLVLSRPFNRNMPASSWTVNVIELWKNVRKWLHSILLWFQFNMYVINIIENCLIWDPIVC